MKNEPGKLAACAVILLLSAAASHATKAILMDDAFVASISPTLNSGEQPLLTVSGGSSINQAFVRFGLSNLPAGVTGGKVIKATLKVFVGSVTAAGSFDVCPVIESWDEADVTYDTRPGLESAEALDVPVTAAHKFAIADLTELVRDWVDGNQTNHGIAIITSSGYFQIHSKENSHSPVLEILLAPGGG